MTTDLHVASAHSLTTWQRLTPLRLPVVVWAVWRQWAVGDVIQVLNGLAAPESVNPEDPPELAWCGPTSWLQWTVNIGQYVDTKEPA